MCRQVPSGEKLVILFYYWSKSEGECRGSAHWLLKIIYLFICYWSEVYLQHCISFRCFSIVIQWYIYMYHWRYIYISLNIYIIEYILLNIYIFSFLSSYNLLQNIEYNFLCHTVGLCQLSFFHTLKFILNIIYFIQHTIISAYNKYFNFLIILFCIEIWLINNVMIVSGGLSILYIVACMCTPNLLTYPSLQPLFPSVTLSLCSMHVDIFLFCK